MASYKIVLPVAALCLVLMLSVELCKAAQINDACNTHGDCTVDNSYCDIPYTACTEGVCVCAHGYYARTDTECRENRDLGDSCEENQDCQQLTVNSNCDNTDVCACEDDETDHTVDGVRYCAKSTMGEACTNDVDCLSYYVSPAGGRCIDDLCGCDNTYNVQGEQCVTVEYMESCLNDEDQTDKECESNLICNQDEECVCPSNSEWDSSRGLCVHEDAVEVGEGESCDLDPLDTDADLCPLELQCGRCPEDSASDTNCYQQSGARTVGVSGSLLAAALYWTWRVV